MKFKKRFWNIPLTVILCGFLTLLPSIASYAEEYPEVTEENCVLLRAENMTQLYNKDITGNTKGIPLYLYLYVSPASQSSFFNEIEFPILVYLYDETTFGVEEYTLFGIDAEEVTELSEGTVYLFKLRAPTGTIILENGYVEEGLLRTNIEFNGSYYSYTEKFPKENIMDELQLGFTLKEDSYILVALTYGAVDYTQEYMDFMDNEERLFLDEPTVQVIEEPTAPTEPIEPTEPEVDFIYYYDEVTPTTEEVDNTEAETAVEEEVIEEKDDLKVWVFGGISVLVLGFISLKFATKKEE